MQFTGVTSIVDDVGTFNGGSFRISHRDSNTILTIQLGKLCPLTAKPGAMVSMSPTMTVEGVFKFEVMKLLSRAKMSHTTFTGPGEVLLAPSFLGDITTIRLSGTETRTWRVAHDAFLAATRGVIKEYKMQKLLQGLFSDEGMFTYQLSGVGLLFITAFGAIVRKDLQEGEKYIVDTGHLVAWDCVYDVGRVASGGYVSDLGAGEGLVCRFTGPGTVFLQTRNPRHFAKWVAGHR